MSHHSSSPEDEARMHAAMQKLLGEYPDGKLRQDDEGAIAVAIGHERGRVTIQFPKPVAWIGFTPEEAIEIAETLVEHARKCGCTKPLEIKIG